MKPISFVTGAIRVAVTSMFLAAAAIPATAGDMTPHTSCGGLFHGFYVGANVGGVIDTTSWSDRDFWLTGTGYTHTQSGATLGVQGGVNHRCGALVVGVEADWNWSNVKSDEFYQARQAELKYDLKSFGSVRGRVGVALDPAFMYFTGGIAFGKHHQEFINVADNVGKTDATKIGLVLGGGMEVALTETVSLKGEALYYNLGTDTYVSHPRVGTGNVFGFDVTDSFWVARVGLNVRFK